MAPIQKMIPDELFLHILSYLDPYTLAKIACVTSSWRFLVEVRLLEFVLLSNTCMYLYLDMLICKEVVYERPHCG